MIELVVLLVMVCLSRTAHDERRANEPRWQMSRYAFGYSDARPGWRFWLLLGVMTAYVVYAVVQVR